MSPETPYLPPNAKFTGGRVDEPKVEQTKLSLEHRPSGGMDVRQRSGLLAQFASPERLPLA